MTPKKFTQSDRELLMKLREKKTPFKTIQKDFFPERSVDSLSCFCKKHRICTRKQERWEPQEIEILNKEVVKGTSFREMVKLLTNRTEATIAKYASDHGLKNYRRDGARKYNCDKNFWDIPNPLNCYWAGFSAADASVSKRDGCFTYALQLQELDIETIERFRMDVKSDSLITDVTTYLAKFDKTYKSNRLSINCNEWEKPLSDNFKIIHRKTWDLSSPKLSDDLLPFYLAGFIDGDGSYVCCEHRLTVSAVGAVPNIMEEIRKLSTKFSPMRHWSNEPKVISSYASRHTIQISGVVGVKMAHHLMSLPCPHLRRKYNKVRQFLIDFPEHNLSLPPYDEHLSSLAI